MCLYHFCIPFLWSFHQLLAEYVNVVHTFRQYFYKNKITQWKYTMLNINVLYIVSSLWNGKCWKFNDDIYHSLDELYFFYCLNQINRMKYFRWLFRSKKHSGNTQIVVRIAFDVRMSIRRCANVCVCSAMPQFLHPTGTFRSSCEM